MKYRYSSLRYGVSPLWVRLSIVTCVVLGIVQAQSSDLLKEEDQSKEPVRHSGIHLNSDYTTNQETAIDSVTSIEEVLSLPSLTQQERALAHLVVQLSEDDAIELVEKIKSISDPAQRLAFLRGILPRLTQLNLEQTLASFSDLSPADQFSTVDSIYANVPIDDEIDAVQASNAFPSELREKALLALMSKEHMTLQRALELAKISPALFTPVIIGLDGYTERYDILEELVQHWARNDVRTTWSLIKDLHAETLDDQLLTACLASTAEIYPLESLEFTHDFFRDYGLVLEYRVFDAIVESDPDIAKELLSKVRKIYGPTRLVYINETLLKLGLEYALEFGQSLPLEDSEWFFNVLDDDICELDPQVFIDALDRIKAVEAVSEISRCMLFEARHDGKLSTSQFEKLHARLIGEDLQRIDEYKRSDFIEGEPK